MTVSLVQAKKAKAQAKRLMPHYGDVAGIGLTGGRDGFALKVNFKKEPVDRAAIPRDVEGVPVQVDVVGRVRRLTG